MLRIDTQKPYALVYSLCKHEFLGYVMEPHIVQLNPDGGFSLTHQRIFSHTAKDFEPVVDALDLRLIKLMDGLEQGALIKRMHKKPIRATEFFKSFFDKKLYDYIRPKIEHILNQIFPILGEKPLYLMSKEGWPVERPIKPSAEAASVLFHFRRNEEETRYFPTIKYQDIRIEFMFKDAQIIVNEPARMLLDETLYHFDQQLDGRKLLPFLNKRYIAVPRNSEPTYYERFVKGLIERHHVYAEGFEIKTYQHEGTPILKLSTPQNGSPVLDLYFKYGPYTFPAGSDLKVSVKLEHRAEEDEYTFHRIKRSLQWENNKLTKLLALGLEQLPGVFVSLQLAAPQASPNAYALVDWLNEHYDELHEAGFKIENESNKNKYLLAQTSINMEVTEDNDWFDVKAMVKFGNYEIPFLSLKDHILNCKREFTLPSGEIAIIPESWFAQFSDLFQFSRSNDQLQLQKYHLGLLDRLDEGEIAHLSIERKLDKLSDFDHIEPYPTPVNFKATLRNYQKAGYDWFHFLKKYRFGGCLADDMGLGKTVQTLALLQKEKEEQQTMGIDTVPSLIVMPTSLIYNWQQEAQKFAPDLKVISHTGANRTKSAASFASADIIITTYGIARIDTELLSEFYFHYIILDESQIIKNPSSQSFKAVKQLKSRYRLILSGTPLENSVADLWSQMTFLNPGLLGGHTYFQNEYVTPIEKKKDEEKARKLQAVIKPFMLRRTKGQVATELPPKTEQVIYCDMSEEQARVYESIKSEYRNLILSEGSETLALSAIQVLQGLTKLRQMANHPKMLDQTYEGSSGKFDNVLYTLETVLSRGHKVLIFSQFVRQLDLFRQHFDQEQLNYAYLDGSTKNREEVVNSFRQNKEVKLFLISIKAGGVGLNLIEADYVFILDPWWNPAVEQQAIDRSHRIGQKKNVFIYKFITKDSVEEKILSLQNRKRTVAEQLITTEETFVKSLSAEDIKELLA